MGVDSCYPLAFGVSAALMAVATVIFMLGSFWYIKNPPKENIIARVAATIFVGFWLLTDLVVLILASNWQQDHLETKDSTLAGSRSGQALLRKFAKMSGSSSERQEDRREVCWSSCSSRKISSFMILEKIRRRSENACPSRRHDAPSADVLGFVRSAGLDFTIFERWNPEFEFQEVYSCFSSLFRFEEWFRAQPGSFKQ